MRSQVPPVCAHCQSVKSPLWRRGANMEVLCNACGLYWKHHNTYRPLALKAAADRKNNMLTSISGEQQLQQRSSSQSAGSTSTHPLAYTNPQVTQFYVNYNNDNQENQSNVRKAGPMRTSNILMIPGQFNQPGYPGNYSRSSDSKRANENILPPLDYKNRNFSASLSTPNALANQRQLSAAPVLPNLKSVMESLSSENVPTAHGNSANKNNNNITINGNSPKNNRSANGDNYQKQNNPQFPQEQQQHHHHQPSSTTTAPSITNSVSMNHYIPKNNFYPQQFNLNAPIKFIIHRGITIYQGDHVSIRGSDSQVYFAILMDFWLTENGKRYCTLRWLLPKPKASFTSALHDRFDLGPIHQRVEAMETILNVFYSPYRDQMTAEVIRRKFLLSQTGDNQNSEIVAVDPPAQLVNAIKSLSGDFESTETKCSSPEIFSVSNENSSILSSSPSSKLFKSSEDVPMNPIIAESSEIAAKMLLSMN